MTSSQNGWHKTVTIGPANRQHGKAFDEVMVGVVIEIGQQFNMLAPVPAVNRIIENKTLIRSARVNRLNDDITLADSMSETAANG